LGELLDDVIIDDTLKLYEGYLLWFSLLSNNLEYAIV